jgi:phenylalanyl-tRNA synthetase beta chain
MRVPLEWLHQYCAPPLDVHALAERLAMTGTEVERVERHGVTAIENFIVGKVLEAGRHPDADRLSVCLVDTGDGEARQIVCGAPNVRAGQTVAVAKPGAVMADGRKLEKAQLRGKESNGMILAEDELAIGTEHAGILVLEDDGLKPGTPLEQVLPIATDVLVLEVTPNRPDCLGIYGVAREVHAATEAPLSTPPWSDDAHPAGEVRSVKITVECPELCPRFTARAFEDVEIKPSPPWLKARLMAAGQRPISNVVDITNYAMLLTGQPLHAFDLDRVAGAELTIRRAEDGETVQTLDGQTRTLDHEMVLIADADGPTSIAGVMGGARSEVEANTTRVLMEVANWIGANIHRTSLKLGVRSEASTRFEKQLQPEQAIEAQAVATQLMVELCGACPLPGTIDIGGPGPPPRTIRLRDARVESLLGAPVARDRSKRILESLEFATAEREDGLDVTVPTFRRDDVTREADLIEEVARIDGLEKLPATLPSRHGASGRLTVVQQLRRAGADALRAQGLHEVLGWSFASSELTQRLRLGDHQTVELENPMSAEQSQLRTTLLGSLLDIAQRNLARGATELRLFEAGAVYFSDGSDRLPREPHHVGALLIGPVRPPTWRDPQPRTADFFAAKGVLEGLLDTLRVPWSVQTQVRPFLHPGRAAEIAVDHQPAGWLGEIHPLIAAEWDIPETIAAFELDFDAVTAQADRTPLYEDVTSYPEVREDLAVVVSDRVSAAQVRAVLRRSGAPLLARAEVFDVYRDPERFGAGHYSLALRLAYRAPDRTLTDEEVAERRQAIAAALADELGGRVRGDV